VPQKHTPISSPFSVQVGAFTVFQLLHVCGCINQNATAHTHKRAAPETEEIIAIFFFFGILGFT
jgi:hypothetical protein